MEYKKYISLGKDSTGKRIRKWIYGNSATDLTRNINLFVQSYKEKKKPTNLLFCDYASMWLETKSSRQASTKNMYETALSKTEDIDYYALEEITRTDLQHLINKHKAHPTACHQLSMTLKQIFNMAVRDGLLQLNPSEFLELPKKSSQPGRALTAEEKEAIKKIDISEEDRMYILILYFFGLRPQEALALIPLDIDIKNQTLHIKRAIGYDKNDPYIKDTKTYKQRKLPIPDAFLDQLIKYSSTKEKNEFLFSRHGKIFTKTMKSKMWVRIKKKINEQLGGNDKIDMTNGLRPYTFRHNFCCECYYRHLSILKTAELLGNSPQMVMKVYAHLDNDKEPIKRLFDLVL